MSGYKTYIIAVALGALAVVHSLGYINDQIYQALMAALGAGGLAALRAGVTKAGQ